MQTKFLLFINLQEYNNFTNIHNKMLKKLDKPNKWLTTQAIVFYARKGCKTYAQTKTYQHWYLF